MGNNVEENKSKSSDCSSTGCCSTRCCGGYKVIKIILVSFLLLALGFFVGRSCGKSYKCSRENYKSYHQREKSCNHSAECIKIKKLSCDKKKKAKESSK